MLPNITLSKCEHSIAGVYTHYKNKCDYKVYCVAYDYESKPFVLYQQLYGDKAFWIRPYSMFFEKVKDSSGKEVDRFTKVKGIGKLPKDKGTVSSIKELEKKNLIIKHTEEEKLYCIIALDYENSYYAVVYPYDKNGGYLSDYHLMYRLGAVPRFVNGKKEYISIPKEDLPEHRKLLIDDFTVSENQDRFSPSSIDLEIANAEEAFSVTKYNKRVDPQSIEHVSRPSALWKNKRLHRTKVSNGKDYLVIRPGETVLTKTSCRIKIPDDCAGKVEIRSTFARLSLSATTGDYLNPGYYGYFPLQITNSGTHRVIIHVDEVMVQLMLIPLSQPVLKRYKATASLVNDKGEDDGSPRYFWKQNSFKQIQRNDGRKDFVDVYCTLRNRIKGDSNSKNKDGVLKRFDDTFLFFCQKKTLKRKYCKRVKGKDIPDTSKIIRAYINRERRLNHVKKSSLSSTIVTICVEVFAIILGLIISNGKLDFIKHWYIYVLLLALALVAGIIAFVIPRNLCSLEEYTIDSIVDKEL